MDDIGGDGMLYPTVGVPFMGRDLLYRYQQYKYTRCLQRAGASVLLLMPDSSEEARAAAINRCAGFLFPGGPDIRPDRYGQKPQPGCQKPDPVRDTFELQLLDVVLAARKPLFCIGRGMQLLNVAFGGTLIQDITDKQEYPHMDFANRASATHPVELDPDSVVSRLLKSDVATVNSLHHQAADTIGEGLWIAADSPEGYPEALEIDDYPFSLAVQWHPEYMARVVTQQGLFQGFAEACRQFSQKMG